MTSRVIQIDDWCFEVVQIRARRTKKFGEKYSATASITIANNVAHIEGLLCTEPELNRDDFKTFTKLIVEMWRLKIEYQRIKNGVKNRKKISEK
jgi:hypothetical protein